MNRFRHMTFFMHIVDAGSLTKAAERLNLSKSVLSQSLRALETDLATTLLQRTTRRQQLTQAGARFYRQCRQMHDIAEQAWIEMQAGQEQASGSLTVTAPHALMNSVVVPAVARAFGRNSQLSLTLICDDAPLDLMQQGIDLAIRVGPSPDSSLRQRRIGSMDDFLCRATGADEDLDQSPYIANHWQPELIRHWVAGTCYRFAPAHRTNTVQQTAALIEHGFGVGILPGAVLHSCSGVSIIAPVAKATIYALHPFASHVPAGVSQGLAAIAEELAAQG